MKEFTPGESAGLSGAPGKSAPRYFRVLVADDDELDRRLTIQQLGKAWPVERDMTVECAADGAEALEMIRSKHYALVVLKWSAPRHDGAVVLRGMRADGMSVPLVVVSGQRSEATASDLEALAAAAVVNQDELDPKSLGTAIATSLLLRQRLFPVASPPQAMRS